MRNQSSITFLTACVALLHAAAVPGADMSGGLAGGGPAVTPTNGDCIPDAQRAAVRQQIEAFLASPKGKIAKASQGPAPTNTQSYSFYPQAGALWQDLFPVNFVDLDSTAGLRDWFCTNYTYNGHNGHDSDILTWTQKDIGVPVFAALDGLVIAAHDGENDTNTVAAGQPANYVVLSHGNGHETWYYHFKKFSVAVGVGQNVRAGQQIGLTASSGNSTGPHLHFETRVSNVVYEPFAGACRSGASLWTGQIPFRTNFYLRDFTLCTNSLASYPGPPVDSPRNGYQLTGLQPVQFWINQHNMPPNTSWRVRFLRPNGTVRYDSGTVVRANPFYRWSWWSWNYTINFDVTGTWKVELNQNNGQLVAQMPFEIVSSTALMTNRPPHPVVVGFDPPFPTPTNVVFCRVLNFTLTDDPDYDLVRYRYEWRVNSNTVRIITNAALSDAIPHHTAQAGDTLTCTVTPSDGVTDGPSATVSTEFIPVLHVRRSHENAIITWPLWATNFNLQGATNLTSSNHWSNVGVATNEVNGTKSVSWPLTSLTNFFRLRR
ncbi:MAG TPA: M23 family metallopeptidase [Methylomirabilota bacterium]|nr:M23 family metallopeptidase [Methylomirabilota bacterium]